PTPRKKSDRSTLRGPLDSYRTRRRAPLETAAMVGVAQLAEHLVVVQDVGGSSPLTHPSGRPGARRAGPSAFPLPSFSSPPPTPSPPRPLPGPGPASGHGAAPPR